MSDLESNVLSILSRWPTSGLVLEDLEKAYGMNILRAAAACESLVKRGYAVRKLKALRTIEDTVYQITTRGCEYVTWVVHGGGGR